MRDKITPCSHWLKIAATAAATATIGAMIFVSFGKGKPVPAAAYTAIRVFDGDLFETKENIHSTPGVA